MHLMTVFFHSHPTDLYILKKPKTSSPCPLSAPALSPAPQFPPPLLSLPKSCPPPQFFPPPIIPYPPPPPSKVMIECINDLRCNGRFSHIKPIKGNNKVFAQWSLLTLGKKFHLHWDLNLTASLAGLCLT